MTRSRLMTLALLPVGVLAVGMIAFAGLSSLQPARKAPSVLERPAPWVEVGPLERRTVNLDVSGRGTVRARDLIHLGPEVAGTVAFVDSALKDGTFVQKDQELIKLDARDQTLGLRMAKAGLAEAESQLARLQTSKEHLESDLELRRERAELAKLEFERQKTLEATGATSKGSADRARSAWLAERSALQAAQQTVDLYPHDLARAEAAVASATVSRDQAQLALDRLTIRSPIAGQVRARRVEVGDVVAPGQPLARIDGHGTYEVAVSVSHDDVTKLAGIPRTALPAELRELPGLVGSPEAQVTWLAHPERPWPGKVTRIESVDTQTRTLPVIVEVEQPWGRLAGGQTPLLPGAYCQVTLAGVPRKGAWVVPEYALREGDTLYVLREERLVIVTVKIVHLLVGEAVIEPVERLKDGDQLILSRLAFPVAGMRLRTGEP